MKVKFDLRPYALLERERKQKSFNLARLAALFLTALFFAGSAGCIAVMTLNSFALRKDVAVKEGEAAEFQSERAALERQLSELRVKEMVLADTLKLLREDLPALEVLCALQANMDGGIGLKTLIFSIDKTVELTGTAASDRQISDFCARLRESGVFESVPPPVAALDAKTGAISFTLRVPVLTIDKIRAPVREL